MDDNNVVMFLDEIKKLIELGNKPQAVIEIDVLVEILNKAIRRKKGKLFQLITIPQPTETEMANPIFMRDFELAHKINEMAVFLNDRFSPQ